MNYFLSFGFALTLASTTTASADEEPTPDLTLASMDTSIGSEPRFTWDTMHGPRPRECTARFFAGQGVGIVLGAAAMAMGSVLTAVGAKGIVSTEKDPAFIGLGSGMLVVGAATIGVSGYSISRNLDRRNEVCGGPRPPDWRRR